MKFFRPIALSLFLITSLTGCFTIRLGSGSGSAPTAPPLPTPTFTPIPTLIPLSTKTPPPALFVQVETAQFEPGQLVIAGQLSGAPAGTVYQSHVNVIIYDAQGQILMAEQLPCADPPHTADAICAFTFSPLSPPANAADYGIIAQAYTHYGSILEGRAGSFPGASEGLEAPTPLPVSEEDFYVDIGIQPGFYFPEAGSYVHANAGFSDISVFDENFPNRELCVTVAELREYESGQGAQVVLTEECRATNSQPEGERTLSISADIPFKPSGYSFVWIDGADGRYRILEVSATATLKQDQQILDSATISHRPAPARVVSASLNPESQTANAVVEIMAGQGEAYEIFLRVIQVEIDPSEIMWSGIAAFIPCKLWEVCEDYTRIGEASQTIALMAGTYIEISANYTSRQTEQDNIIVWNKIDVYLDGVYVGGP